MTKTSFKVRCMVCGRIVVVVNGKVSTHNVQYRGWSLFAHLKKKRCASSGKKFEEKVQ